MNRIRIRSLKHKIILAFLVISAALITLQMGVFQHWIDSIMLRQTEAYFQETVRQIGKRVDLQYRQIDENAKVIHNNQVIKNYLKDLKSHRINYQIAKYQIARQIVRLPDLEMIDNIYIFPVGYAPMNLFYTKAVFETDEQTKRMLSADPANRPEGVVWTVQAESRQISMMTLMYDGDDPLGVLRVDLNDNFHDQLNDVKLGESGSVYLVNRETVLFAKDRRLVNRDASALERLSGTRVDYALDYQGWKLIGIVPNTEITKGVNQVNRIMLLMEMLVLVLIFIFARVILRLILVPLKKIMKGMESIQQGKLNVIVEDVGNDEFSVITRHFNYMVEKVNGLIKTVYNQQLSYRKAEIVNLQAKLNPHFLYNTLNMIYWMSVVKDEEEIGDAILSLSNILRYSISHSNEFVTVAEDMEQLDNYLKIQGMRFENKLHYEFDIDKDMADMRIPKLLLQPLVENSIKYAFQEMSRDGAITIRGFMEEDDLVFEVADNGVGMTSEQVASLLAPSMDKGREGGLGIHLVRQRIKYGFGEEDGITIASAIGKGTSIIVKLRKKPEPLQEEPWRTDVLEA
ncbi:cache domain-containing sensor histidine kinase [Paenibacillus arenilitoris]|uniref:histidine kinase n=1 Tax=Paenibacillus arenilitoris TaxID=2772299 RepID=A0A927CNW5_9BACL|nr:sensor histidine kinase [Paenibacillus arenilitoris]MBD2869035.1 sensor histidine kinase [Paenibacillus arenilitoris]